MPEHQKSLYLKAFRDSNTLLVTTPTQLPNFCQVYQNACIKAVLGSLFSVLSTFSGLSYFLTSL